MADNDPRKRQRSLESIEEQMVEVCNRLHAQLAGLPAEAPLPPQYISALKETHRALAAGHLLAAKAVGSDARDPHTLLLELEQATAQVRRRIQLEGEMPEAPRKGTH